MQNSQNLKRRRKESKRQVLTCNFCPHSEQKVDKICQHIIYNCKKSELNRQIDSQSLSKQEPFLKNLERPKRAQEFILQNPDNFFTKSFVMCHDDLSANKENVNPHQLSDPNSHLSQKKTLPSYPAPPIVPFVEISQQRAKPVQNPAQKLIQKPELIQIPSQNPNSQKVVEGDDNIPKCVDILTNTKIISFEEKPPKKKKKTNIQDPKKENPADMEIEPEGAPVLDMSDSDEEEMEDNSVSFKKQEIPDLSSLLDADSSENFKLIDDENLLEGFHDDEIDLTIKFFALMKRKIADSNKKGPNL